MPAVEPTIAARIGDALDQARCILVITHVVPDGDALGSLAATGLALSAWDAAVTLVCDDGLLERFKYLPLADQVQRTPPIAKYDLVIALDAGDLDRLGDAYRCLPNPRPPIINIDHHITNTEYGWINLIEPRATSTTEILYHLWLQLGVSLTEDLAVCLLTGLLTDTLGFRISSVNAETLAIASALVEAGANLAEITRQALILKSVTTLQLWRVGLNHMRLEDGLMWTSISFADRQAIGHNSGGTFGLGNLLADVPGVAMSVVLLELADGRVTIGFRSHPPFDVSGVARDFGGGGHRQASGCTVDGPLDEVEVMIVTRCKGIIQQQRASVDYAIAAG